MTEKKPSPKNFNNNPQNQTAEARQREHVVRTSKKNNDLENKNCNAAAAADADDLSSEALAKEEAEHPTKEYNGYETEGLLEPTRFGDWEVKGRCSDF